MAKGTGFIPCTGCGGTGAKTKIEIVMKNGKPQSIVVRVVCTDCKGKGGYHV